MAEFLPEAIVVGVGDAEPLFASNCLIRSLTLCRERWLAVVSTDDVDG
jgi:hypothetical protein